MGSELRTREGQGRAVIANALTKPINVLVPAGLLVAGFLLHWLLVLAPVAAVAYGLLVWLTVFDENEATRVLARGGESPLAGVPELTTAGLPEELAEPLGTAIAEEGKIEQAIAQAKLPYGDVTTEVKVLMGEMQKVAQKGGVIHSYLTDPEVANAGSRLAALKRDSRSGGAAADAQRMAIEALESQVKIRQELADQYERCCAELEHLAASLGTIRGQIVRMSVAEDASIQDDLAGQVRSLRERVGSLAEGLSETTSQLEPGRPPTGSAPGSA